MTEEEERAHCCEVASRLCGEGFEGCAYAHDIEPALLAERRQAAVAVAEACERVADKWEGSAAGLMVSDLRAALAGDPLYARADEDIKRHMRDKERYRELLIRAEGERDDAKAELSALRLDHELLKAEHASCETLEFELKVARKEVEECKATVARVTETLLRDWLTEYRMCIGSKQWERAEAWDVCIGELRDALKG